MANNTQSPASNAGAVHGTARFIWRPLRRTNTVRNSAAAGPSARANCHTSTQAMLTTNNRLATARAVSRCQYSDNEGWLGTVWAASTHACAHRAALGVGRLPGSLAS
jgi:hypothetical protein